MRNLTLTLSLLFLGGILKAQDLPKIIPPSPEAISMIQYGNTGVSFYTGQPNLSVPIHTVSVRGYQFPVSLSYTSFQGINLESIAPWVGLGWSLNATASVSRTIRDLPDDETLKGDGYMILPEPDVSDEIEMLGYHGGTKDKEPDTFYFNANGLSGSFFINRQGDVVQKTKSEVVITYAKQQEINSFTITGTDGIQYYFDQKEKAISLGQGQSTSDVPNATTSWYISNIKDQNGNELMNFQYHDLANLNHTSFSAQTVKVSAESFQPVADQRYTHHTTTAKRIKEINWSGGKVLFQLSDSTRQDYYNDRYLSGIKILDGVGNEIRQYTLGFSYFDTNATNGVSDIDADPSGVLFNTTLDVGDYYKRLKLDQIQEWNADSTLSLPPFQFEYNMNHNLPSRYSFAKDHWGFYNGQDGNNSPEPVYRYQWIQDLSLLNPQFERTFFNHQLGSSNREAYAEFGKSGVLKKVIYPSGGSTEFEMEGNQVIEDKLPNDIVVQTPITVPLNNTNSSTFDVTLINEPFTIIRVQGFVGQTCNVSAKVFKTGEVNPVLQFDVPYINGAYSHNAAAFLEPGTGYYVTLGYYGGCTYTGALDQLSVTYENEVALTNKVVGGLRVKQITDHDGISALNDVKRYFHYNEDGEAGTSTGRLVSLPVYAQQTILPKMFFTAIGPGLDEMMLYGLIRNMRSTYPLLSTNGSFVGYKKVTVINGDDHVTGKTEYEFTTTAEYPVFRDAYFSEALAGEGFFEFGPTADQVYETFPFAENDDRNYLRGLLKRQTSFKWNGAAFDTASSVNNEYAFTFNIPQDGGGGLNQLPAWPTVAANAENYSYVTGLKLYTLPVSDDNLSESTPPWTYKRYRFYAGRMDLNSSTSRQFSATNPAEYLETNSTTFWDDLANNHYQASRSQTTDSEGNTYESKTNYPYNSISGIDTGSQTVLDSMVARNMIAAPVEQEQYREGVKLSTTRTIFRSFADGATPYYLPGWVQTAKAANALETRVRYHQYDSLGNPLEVSQEDGTHIAYVWGYNKTLPVAKLQNATFAQVEAVLGLDFDLGSNGLSATQADSLRAISGALVTTIEYQWGVGMKSQTDPNGLTTTYHYDSFGRLKWVEDPDGNIINTYKYNYKGQ